MKTIGTKLFYTLLLLGMMYAYGNAQDTLYQHKIGLQLFSYQKPWGAYNDFITPRNVIGISYERVLNPMLYTTYGIQFSRSRVTFKCSRCASYAFNEEGIHSEFTLSAGIKVRPPIWRTWRILYPFLQSELFYDQIRYDVLLTQIYAPLQLRRTEAIQFYALGVLLKPGLDFTITKNIHISTSFSLLFGGGYSKNNINLLSGNAEEIMFTSKGGFFELRGIPLTISAAIAW